MYSQYKEDVRILKKAKARIQTALIVSVIAICLYPAGMFFILEQPFFTKPDFFNLLYLGSMLSEMVIWLLLFYFASTGKPSSRTLFRIGVIAEAVFSLYLLFDMFRHIRFLVIYLAWFIMLTVKNIYLWWFSGWLKTSYWGKIFYDHVLVMPASQKPSQKQNSQPAPSAAGPRQSAAGISVQQSSSRPAVRVQAQPDFQTPVKSAARIRAEREEKKNREERLSSRYPRMAIRIIVFVLAEMIVFPVLVHLFQNSFVSIDNTSVFADNMEFTMAIVTTVLWIIPVFFLYLKSPGWKKVLYLTVLAQFVVIGFELFMLWQYHEHGNPSYSTKVFLQYAMVELARYAILAVGVAPAFRLPEIKEDTSTDEDDEELLDDVDEVYEIRLEEEPDDEPIDEDSSDTEAQHADSDSAAE